MQPIYLGGKLLAAMDLAEHQRHFSEHQKALVESSVYYQTDIQYLTTVARKELTGVTANLCQSMEDLRTIIKQRVDCGLVDQQDLWMVEVKLNEAKFKYLETQNSYEVGVMALNALIGEEAQTKTQVENTLSEITTYTQQAANQRPEIDMAHDQVELAKVQKKFNDSKYRPQISAGISGSYGSPAYDFNPDLDPNMGAFVQVHIPLYEWGKRRKERKANQLKIEMANEQLLQQEENISLQQAQAQLTINQCIKSLELAKSSLEKAEQNQATILTRYESGLVPIVSVIDAQLYTETAYSNFVRSKLNAQIAYSELQRALHLYPINEVSK
jgi:outer membrane protein TolC